MVKSNLPMVRRQFLRRGLIGTLVLLGPICYSLSGVDAMAKQELDDRAGFRIMIEALRMSGNPACMNAAAKLEEMRGVETHYDLHLRSSGLRTRDAEIIAGALRTPGFSKGPILRSLSMSHNEGLKDDGVVVLAHSLPADLEEMGLVGCAIGDKGGAALLRWATQAAGLKMLCVEGNRFSEEIRQGFTLLRQGRENLQIFV